MKLGKEVGKVYDKVRKNKGRFALSCLADLGFFIVFMIVFMLIVMQIFLLNSQLTSMVKGMADAGDDLESQSMYYTNLAASMEMKDLVGKIITYALLLAVLVFVVWVIFQSMAWYLAHRMNDKKTRYLKYASRLAVVSGFFYLLMVLSFILTIYLSIANAKIGLPVFPQVLVNILLVLLLLVIYYFWFVALFMLKKEGMWKGVIDAFKIGVKKFKGLARAFLLVVVVMVVFSFIVSLLLDMIVSLPFLLLLIIFLVLILVFFCTMSFLRLLYIHLADKIIKQP